MTTDQTPGTDLVYASASLRERQEYAKALAAAGDLVPSGFRDKNGAANPAKLLLVFETGSMLQIHPLAALNGIHVIEGKPTISAGLMSALVRHKGHKLRVKTSGSIEDNTFTVTATLIRADDPSAPFESVWNIDRARRAELFGKATWRRYPEAMLKARAISEVCREGAEDALMGVAYVPEELGAEVNEAGDVIDGEIVEDEPGPRHTGNRGHASETRVTTAPDTDATRGSDKRPGPSRPVTSPGTGRVTPPKLPPQGETPEEATQRAVDDFVEWIAAQEDIEELRDLHGTASAEGLLQQPTRDGRRLNDVFYQRREAILQAQEMPPALDGIEDDA